MGDEFILMRDSDGMFTYSDIEAMTKSEREYMMHLAELHKKAKEKAMMVPRP